MKFLTAFINLFQTMTVSEKCIFFLLCVLFFLSGMFFTTLKNRSLIAKIRADSVNRSRAVLGGQMIEQMAPYLPGFPCNPADCRFLGKPVDIVAFCGAAENERISEIVFVEVKTGKSQLSSREKEIKECIQKGKIRYEVYRWNEGEIGSK